MATLQGKAIKDTYKDLLQVSTNNNTGVTAAMSTVEDGEGTSSALKICTTGVEVAGDLNVTGSVTGVPHVDYRGNYSASTAYVADDVVFYNGSSYIAKQSSTGNAPTNTTYWGLLAQKGTDGTDGTNGTNGTNGATGPQGPQGPAGPAGADGSDASVSTNLNNIDSAITANSSGETIINDSIADADFRVASEGNSNKDLLVCDASRDNVGIGQFPSNTYKLDVDGSNRGNIANFEATSDNSACAIFVRNLSSTGQSAIVQLVNQTGTSATARSVDMNCTQIINAFQVAFGQGQNNGVRLIDGSNSGTSNAPAQDGCSFEAQADNVMTLGRSGSRWAEIFCTNGTINPSDVNLKQDIEDLSEAEKNVATQIKGLIKKFRWKDAVAEKGDDARIHIGVIAQEVESAFTSQGLDPRRYSLFCEDTYWIGTYEEEVPDPDNEGQTKVVTGKDVSKEEKEGYTKETRLSVRYDELLAFVISAI